MRREGERGEREEGRKNEMRGENEKRGIGGHRIRSIGGEGRGLGEERWFLEMGVLEIPAVGRVSS